MKNKIEELQDSINFTRLELKRLEGEFDFLLNEANRFHEMNVAAMTKKIIEDPKFAKIMGPSLGEKFIEDTKRETQEVLDGVPIDKEELKKSFMKMVDILVALHKKQITSYSELATEVEGVQSGEYLDDEFSKGLFNESLDKSQASHQKMVDFYLQSKDRFLNEILR